MTLDDLDPWAAHFEAFHARFASLFARSEPREQARKYLRGLLSTAERKNSWSLAELVGDGTPDAMQRLLYAANWDADEARDRLLDFAIDTFGEADAIGVLDETGFLKKGTHSVGVQRQYTGTAGKIDNAQVGTFLGYRTTKGHLLLDRRLFLPQRWAEDAARRQRAQVPEGVVFQTKSEQAIAMLAHAWSKGVPMRYVTGDEVYGKAPALRRAIDEAGRVYVLAVSRTTPVWIERPALEHPSRRSASPAGGRPRTKVRLHAEAERATTVAEVAARWPAQRWQRLALRQGEKGPILYDWARGPVIESEDGLPSRTAQLVVRRSTSDATDLAYYLSNAPQDAPLAELATVAAHRFSIEQCFEEAKQEAGLAAYQVRTWPSWHRHITLSMMAYAFLASIKQDAQKKTLPSQEVVERVWPQ